MDINTEILDELILNLPNPKEKSASLDKLLYNQVIFEMPKIESKSKTKTIARIFGKSRNENFISDWLAYLFESNSEVLNTLLNMSGSETEISDYTVTREYTFSSSRRIDFLIESENIIVGIENKIDSGEQIDQLKDYSDSLKILANERECIMILLVPKSNELSSNYGFVKVTYEDYIEKIKNIQLNFIENLRSSFLQLDFIKHMEENILMTNNDGFVFNEWTEYIFKYAHQIKTIQKAVKTEEKNIIEFIKDKMKELVNEPDLWRFGNQNYEDKYIQFYKSSWGGRPNVHFEFVRDDKDIIPTKFILRLDIESAPNSDKSIIRDEIGVNKYINEIDSFNINYSSEEEFDSSINKMMVGLSKLIDQYTDIIDDIFNDKQYNKE